MIFQDFELLDNQDSPAAASIDAPNIGQAVADIGQADHLEHRVIRPSSAQLAFRFGQTLAAIVIRVPFGR